MIVDDISHCFVGKGYAKIMQVKEGHLVVSHQHKYDHDSHLVFGTVGLLVDGTTTKYTAPAIIKIKAGVNHGIVALTDVLWICAHEVSDEDIGREDIDEVLIA